MRFRERSGLSEVRDLADFLGFDAALIVVAALAVVIGAVVIQRSRKDMVAEPEDEKDPLAIYRDAFERGQMDEAEYRHIIDAMGQSLDEVTRKTVPRTSSETDPRLSSSSEPQPNPATAEDFGNGPSAG